MNILNKCRFVRYEKVDFEYNAAMVERLGTNLQNLIMSVRV